MHEIYRNYFTYKLSFKSRKVKINLVTTEIEYFSCRESKYSAAL